MGTDHVSVNESIPVGGDHEVGADQIREEAIPTPAGLRLLPELGRGGLNVAFELAGAAACWWGWRRFRLDEPDRRALFAQTGRVGRDITP